MDFGQASMPHAPEAQTPEVPYDMTTSAPDRPAIPLSPDMLSGNLQGNGSEKSGIEFSFDAFGYTQQVELVRESYADGNLAVTALSLRPHRRIVRTALEQRHRELRFPAATGRDRFPRHQ